MGARDHFAEQVQPFRSELLAHCYRMTGALSDAEDALQNALVRAWKAFDSFEGRSSLRTWLYKITTNACLDTLAGRKARTMPEFVEAEWSPDAAGAPSPSEADVAWLEPFPQPDSAYENREAVRLAFVIALQVLPPRQRAVLILREVVGMSAEETADALEMSVAAVNSAMQRARAVLDERPRAKRQPVTGKVGELLGTYLRLWEAKDTRGLIQLLAEDAVLSMPPAPMWAHGPEAIIKLYETVVFPMGKTRGVPCSVNGQPAFAMYSDDGQLRALSVMDIDEHGKIISIQAFLGVDAATYGVPPTLPLTTRVELLPGAQLGRYHLEYVLGSGGMGQVWLAHDTELERDVAIKVLRDEIADNAEARARLLREARAMARVRHPNVLAIHDVTKLAGHDVLVIELIDGEDMARWAARGQPPAALRSALCSAAQGLAAVHAAGVLHRDFKPANVLVGKDGRIVVGDFGLSRSVDGPRGSMPSIPTSSDATTRAGRPGAATGIQHDDTQLGPPTTGKDVLLTEEGIVMGTPAYMPPEQLRGEDADARSDQFAFCMTAWELLAGMPPYSSRDLEALARGEHVDPRAADHIDDAMRAVLLRGLAADREARWPDLAPVIAALR